MLEVPSFGFIATLLVTTIGLSLYCACVAFALEGWETTAQAKGARISGIFLLGLTIILVPLIYGGYHGISFGAEWWKMLCIVFASNLAIFVSGDFVEQKYCDVDLENGYFRYKTPGAKVKTRTYPIVGALLVTGLLLFLSGWVFYVAFGVAVISLISIEINAYS